MKRIYTYILLIACTMVFASCQKDFDGVLTATLQDYRSDSKVHLNSQRYACWDNGDKVSINGDKNCSVVFNNTANPTEATININKQESKYRAVYPASYDGGDYVINLPQNQKYNEKDGKQVIEAPMVAYTTNSILSFYNLCSLIKVTFPTDAEVMNVVITELNGQKLWGKLSYSQNENANPSVSTISNEDNIKNIVTMDIPETYRQSLKGKSVYITIPPTLGAKLSIKLYYKRMSDNKNCKGERSMNRTCDFETSKLYNISMSSGVEVTNLGSGTKGDPYLISSAEEFRRLVGGNPSSCFKQMNDLDLGSNYEGIQNFSGTYDGDNHTITIGSENIPNPHGGVFSTISNGANIERVKVNAHITSSDNCGGLVDKAILNEGESVVFSNCSVSGSIKSNGYGGGICGSVSFPHDGQAYHNLKANFDRCINNASIEGKDVGGILGYMDAGSAVLTNCVNHGNITTTLSGGGFIGKANWSKHGHIDISNSYSDGSIGGSFPSHSNNYEGGIGGVIGKMGVCAKFNKITNVYIGGTINLVGKWIVGHPTSAQFDIAKVYRPNDDVANADNTGNNTINSSSEIFKYNKSTWFVVNSNGEESQSLVDALNANRGSNEEWVGGTGQPKLEFETQNQSN